jgi:hypothetical protein
MEAQIDQTMKKAFYDLIEENTNSTTPDFEWVIRLYCEIKHNLLYYLKKDSNVYRTIDESFDVELFSQMIKADVFSPDSMYKLVENTFYWIQALGAPERDSEVLAAKQRVLVAPLNKIIGIFLKEVHQCITTYDDDMRKYILSTTPPS